ncbi:DUF1542 domain-containing protein [Streptococcus pseudopneumoniae]|uniref:DUF1542 domain-containing protein n=1 Tax=Streptococcus pseudopneumoniae TaxID=257758 RepID=UPI0018B0A0E6|nr:DUF1542 domain-containing protein [Streptococcus pseudopneumoniae]MBF9677009.1 DUF1542 domain-containing protein [Streptococcus pseudopneumoniae]
MFYKGNEDREKRLRFSIRKVSFGAASVAVAALFMFPGNGTVSATEQGVTPTNEGRQGSPLKEPDVQNGTYGATPVVSQLDGNSGTSEASAPKGQEETSTPTSTDASAPSVESPTVSKEKEETSTTASATEEKSAEKNTEVPSTEANSVENKEQARVKTEEKAATPVTESHKPKLRKKRAVDASPTVATDADSDANQVYTAPRANAGLDELKEKLQELPNAIQNNTKVNNMDGLGAATGVEAGKVKEITEFGGWKAVNQADGSAGKFVVARATDKGVFPIETINTVGSDRKAWIGEQSVDRNSKYMLFLSEVRTQATRNKESYESLPYEDRQRDKRGAVVAIGVKGYKGVEKTFKVYDTKTPGKVTVDFKTGFSGIIESGSDVTVANYKVEVFSISNSGETKVYTTEFDPKKPSDDDKKTVVAAKVSTRAQSTNVAGITEANKAAALEELAKDRYKPYATGGRFTSKEIELPEGTTEYKVRISAANDRYLGMDYHSRFEQYALPLTGVGFNISQNTNVIAKDLLTKIYAKLKETVVEDEKGMTTDSIAAYDAELVKVQTLVEATNLTTTDAYKVALTTALQKKDELKVDKSTLISSKASLDDLVNDYPTPGKTPETVEEYNLAKTAAEQEAEKAKAVIDSDTATVDEVAQAVANVTAKRAELTAARALLVVAATDAQKTKLQNDSEALKEANKTGKTPKSIKEYEDKYKTLEAALTAAKEQAKTVLDKTVNAGKVEATYAQIEVDKIKAELDKAATLLKDKGNTTELEQAKNDLNDFINQQTTARVTEGQTKDSQDAYTTAKAAADKAVTDAQAVIDSENSTVEDVANALAEIKVKRAALEAAKKNLVPAATDAQKEKLAAEAAKLEKASLEGKTPDSVNEYNAKYDQLATDLEAAKQAAQEVAKKGTNASEVEALKAQEQVNAIKAKLAEAAGVLKDQANKDALTQAKAALEGLTGETEPTGKTTDSLATYTAAKEAAVAELVEAQKVIDNQNASQEDVAAAVAKVNEKKAALETAKAGLVPAATDAQKEKLAAEAAKLEKASLEGKTPDSVNEYNAKYDQLATDLEAAKQAAQEVAKKGTNASEVEALKAQEQVNAIKAKLAEAAGVLKDIDKSAVKKEVEEAAKNATDAIESNVDLPADKKAEAKAKIADEANKAIATIDDATTEDDVTTAKNSAKLAIAKELAKAELEAAKAIKEKAIAGNDKLSDDEKQAVKEQVKNIVDEAKKAIDTATGQSAVDSAKTTGKEAIDALNPVGKEKALDEINRINPIPSPRHLLTTNNQPGNSGNVNTTEPASPSVPTSPSDSGQANSGQDGRSTDSGSTTTARSSVSPVTTTEPTVNTANREDDTVRSATQSQGTLDKSELSKQVQTLENLLRSLTAVSNPITDSARLVLTEAQKALADDSLTEQGLRHILQTVKDAIASLESIKESQSATKAGEQKVSEAAPEADKPAAQTQVPVGIIAASILVLLGLLFFLLARRNKESELEKLAKELSKLLKDSNLETVDKDVLENSQEELQKAVSFLADEKGSEHTEAELIDNLKKVIAKLKANA